VSSRGAMLVAVLLVGCHPESQRRRSEGNLEIRWSGREHGRISALATAGWCPPRHVLEIRTIRGDTGIAFALYPAETLSAGVYRVVDPVRAESLAPAAAVALRWLTPKLVQGFRGESGSVRLERSRSGQVSGEVSARARSVVDTQRVTVTGTFRDLTVTRQPPQCGTAPPASRPGQAPEPRDTGVH
jgi:hypothetical protein